jgi:hypothetical protein
MGPSPYRGVPGVGRSEVVKRLTASGPDNLGRKPPPQARSQSEGPSVAGSGRPITICASGPHHGRGPKSRCPPQSVQTLEIGTTLGCAFEDRFVVIPRGAGVMPLVGEAVAGAVPQHVDVGLDAEVSLGREPLEQLRETRGSERGAPLQRPNAEIRARLAGTLRTEAAELARLVGMVSGEPP